jgi:hypothetical protein
MAGPACDGIAATWARPSDVPDGWIGDLWRCRKQGEEPPRWRSEVKGAQVWPDVPDLGPAGKCTRLDLCVDLWVTSDWEPPSPAPPIGKGTAPREVFTLEPEYQTSDDGETWYAGARTSEVRWRWYYWRKPQEHRPPIVLETWRAAGAGEPDEDGVVVGKRASGAVAGWVPGAPGRVYRCEVQLRGLAAEHLYPIARENIAAAWAECVECRYQTGWPRPPCPENATTVPPIPPKYIPELETIKANMVLYASRQAARYARRCGMSAKAMNLELWTHLRRWLDASLGVGGEFEFPATPPKQRKSRRER